VPIAALIPVRPPSVSAGDVKGPMTHTLVVLVYIVSSAHAQVHRLNPNCKKRAPSLFRARAGSPLRSARSIPHRMSLPRTRGFTWVRTLDRLVRLRLFRARVENQLALIAQTIVFRSAAAAGR
jgi:hypothetical protein